MAKLHMSLSWPKYDTKATNLCVVQWEHREPGRKSCWEDETRRRQESYRKMNVFSTESAEKLQENSLVEQMWYFLTVAYLLGARTRQI